LPKIEPGLQEADELSVLSDEQLRGLVKAKFWGRQGDAWIPNGAQLNFIKLVGGARDFEENEFTWVEAEDRYNFINIFVGANGSGKTDVICHMAGVLLGIINNPFFEKPEGGLYDFFSYPPALGRGRIISNSTTIRDQIIPRLLEILPAGSYVPDKAGKDYYSVFRNPANGRQFNLMTYEQEVVEFRSVSLGWVIFDEPEDKPAIFLETTARFRRGGKIMFTLTPEAKSAWVHQIALGNTRWAVGAVYADIEANCKEHGERGFLEHIDIERMIAGWSEEERAAKAHAQWMHLRGLVYPMWERKVHVIDPLEIPEEGTIYCVMDPHTSRPNFISWFKACPNGRLYQIREWPEVVRKKIGQHGNEVYYQYYDEIKHDSRSFEDIIDIINGVEDEIGVSYLRIMDGQYGNTPYTGTKAYYQEYNSRGCHFTLSNKDPYLRRGHNRVRALLRHQNVMGESDKQDIILPRFQVSSQCVNSIRSVERYVFNPDGNMDSENVMETGKDPMDNWRMMSDVNWKCHDPQLFPRWHSKMMPVGAGTPRYGIPKIKKDNWN
jgi:hypothetical protein